MIHKFADGQFWGTLGSSNTFNHVFVFTNHHLNAGYPDGSAFTAICKKQHLVIRCSVGNTGSKQ